MANPLAPDPQLVDRLAEHRGLGSAPREELEWVAARGTLRHLDAGGVLRNEGETVEHRYILLPRRVTVDVNLGAGPQKLLGCSGGDVLRMRPYSRVSTPRGISIDGEASGILAVGREQFREMAAVCREVTAKLVHSMLGRARTWKERREPLPLETSVPGVFAAGDLRASAMNRVASAVGEGSLAVRLALDYLALT